ncbi:MAG: hypothetical protein LBS07_03040 [Prevotellaceae bacterium]|jgi:hypothetical protein|nr:hypothetical protein [Prevotellaceae bacterium]
MKKNYVAIIVFFVIAFAFFSCEAVDENCRKERFVVASVDFKKAVIDALGKQSLSSFAIDSVTVSGLDSDSLIADNKKKLSSVDLYLNKFAEETKFSIAFNDTIDTLIVWHRNTEEYLSFQCGCIVTHLIDSVGITGHFIDSISIKNNEVNTLNAKNIELYRHYNYYTGN